MALANSYLDFTGFKERTIAPASLVDGVHLPVGPLRVAWVTFVERQLVTETSRINARLRKRYAVPFGDPAPEIVCDWLTARVTPKLYMRRGWDSSDEQADDVKAAAAVALEEMKEAADSETGLYDLPPLNTSTETGVNQGGPFVYSEATPYEWLDVQREEALK